MSAYVVRPSWWRCSGALGLSVHYSPGAPGQQGLVSLEVTDSASATGGRCGARRTGQSTEPTPGAPLDQARCFEPRRDRREQ
jgi:hypothetical protein